MADHRSNNYFSTVEKVLFQPWFLPKRVTFAIHSLVPPAFWTKMRNFFDDYGCIICGKETGYHSNGMCKNCFDKTRKKLAQSVKRHLGPARRRRIDLELFRQQKLAKKLLGRFCDSNQASKRRRRIGVPTPANPVYEALTARPE
jgi:hypothetical protein